MILKTIEEICTEICENTKFDYLDDEKKVAIAPKLAKLLIDANAVNALWTFQNPYVSKESIVSLLKYVEQNLIAELLQKGLDLNLKQHACSSDEYNKGVTPLTWMIGQAENDTVVQILALAEQYQTSEQRLVWINTTDLMTRHRSLGLFGFLATITRVEQTALQLSIAKGYQDQTGNGESITCSNLKLSETLLRLGEDKAINYQEPTLGNTALHIAYARRDSAAIQLLQQHGASQDIRNAEGQIPAELLALRFDQAIKLLEFHTSPDFHSRTFRLDEKEFHDQSNLEKIKREIKFERKRIDVEGIHTKIPGTPFQLNTIETLAILNNYAKISMIIDEGAADLGKTIQSFQDRINLLNFLQEDGLLIFQRLPWKDYIQKRTVIDTKTNGLTNPYMFDIDETGYKKYQDWINENEAEAESALEKNIHTIFDMLSKLEDGIRVLKIFELKEAALKNDAVLVQKWINAGIDTDIITVQLQQKLAALEFQRTLQTLVTALFQDKTMEWKDFDDQIKSAWNNAGGKTNAYLPDLQLRHDETQAEFNELKSSISSISEETLNGLTAESANLAGTYTKYDNALQLIRQTIKDLKSQQPRSIVTARPSSRGACDEGSPVLEMTGEQLRSNNDLFCFFSGFAHQDVEVRDYQENLDLQTIVLTCHNTGEPSLLQDDYIQLDGVLFQIIETQGSSFKACTTFELANHTSIKNIGHGSKLTLGILAEKDITHDRLWMLQPSALNQVTYLDYSVQEGHEHTLKLDFEAPLELTSVIRQNGHLGLAGSSLTARDVSNNDGLIRFSIYCGRETREKSQFNEKLKPGTKVNITEPGEITDRPNRL